LLAALALTTLVTPAARAAPDAPRPRVTLTIDPCVSAADPAIDAPTVRRLAAVELGPLLVDDGDRDPAAEGEEPVTFLAAVTCVDDHAHVDGDDAGAQAVITVVAVPPTSFPPRRRTIDLRRAAPAARARLLAL